MTWHLLQVSDVLDMEFGSALAERVPLIAWEPEKSFLPWWPFSSNKVREVEDPRLTIRRFTLLRGYARPGMSALSRIGWTVTAQLLKKTADPRRSPLICTTPYLAPVADRWPGPVIYWLTDRMEQYRDVNAAAVHRLDRRMCQAASLVCPNSRRIADYLMDHGRCPEHKIRLIPNATRQANLLPAPPDKPGMLPEEIADLPRPIAGIIGNLAGNMNWEFLADLISATPEFSWVFVGPTSMPIPNEKESDSRLRVMHMANVRFVGRKPYGALASFARCFDVAVLPYRLCEPTYSGSSTRFYEHLAACRPMIATRGFEELLHKEPMLRLVDTSEQAASALHELHSISFNDGIAAKRWQESQKGTWQARAAFLQHEVEALQTSGSALPAIKDKSSLCSA